MTTLAGHGKDPRLIQTELPLKKRKSKPSLPKGIKIGDMVTCLEDGTIGQITHLCDRCINIKTADGIQSHSLELGVPKLEIHTHPNQSVVFAIGDRVTLASKNYDFGKFGMGATVISKKWDNKLKLTRISIQFDDGSIETNHFQGAGWFKKLEEKECLPTTIGLEVLEPSVMQPDSHAARSKQSDIQTSAKTRKKSISQTFPMSQSLRTSEKLSHPQGSTCLQVDSHAQEPQTQEQKQDSHTQSLHYGLNTSESSTKENPDLSSLKTLPQLSITDYEQYLADSEWLDIRGTIRKSYKQLSSEVPKNAKDCLSLPTLTTNKSVTSRSSGQSKCEKWFRDKGLLLDTQCLSPQMMAALFNFPTEWTKCLWDAQEDRQDALKVDISSEEQSISTVVSQSLKESSTSINASTVDIDERNLVNPDDAIATKPSKSVEISLIDEVLVVNNSSPGEHLAYLQSERDRLIAMGASPQGIWIEKSKPANKPFIQAVWKSDKPRPEWGDKKSKYIGEYGKENHISAIAQHKAGQELRKIEREIKKLQAKS